MSSPGFGRCPAFEPARSARFAAALAALHAAGLVAVAAAQVPLTLKALLAVAVLTSAWRALTVHALRTAPASVVRIALRADGRWLLQRRDGRTVMGTLHGDSFIHPLFVVVGVTDGGRSAFVPMPADALPPDEHRRLRVLVKWAPTAGCTATRHGERREDKNLCHRDQRVAPTFGAMRGRSGRASGVPCQKRLRRESAGNQAEAETR